MLIKSSEAFQDTGVFACSLDYHEVLNIIFILKTILGILLSNKECG